MLSGVLGLALSCCSVTCIRLRVLGSKVSGTSHKRNSEAPTSSRRLPSSLNSEVLRQRAEPESKPLEFPETWASRKTRRALRTRYGWIQKPSSRMQGPGTQIVLARRSKRKLIPRDCKRTIAKCLFLTTTATSCHRMCFLCICASIFSHSYCDVYHACSVVFVTTC